MLSRVKRLLSLRWTVKPLCAVLVLLVGGRLRGMISQSPVVGPHERDKDLTAVYGRYEIYEAVQVPGSRLEPPQQRPKLGGQGTDCDANPVSVSNGLRIENPTYTVWFYPDPPGEGVVVPRSEWWSSMYGLSEGHRR